MTVNRYKGSSMFSANADAEKWSLALSTIVFSFFIANIALGFQNVFGINQQSVSFLAKIIVVLSIARCMPSFIRLDIRPILAIIGFIIVLFCVQSTLFREQNTWFMPLQIDFITLCLPVVLCMAMMPDYDVALKYLLYVSIGISVIVSLSIVFIGSRMFSGYAMGMANSLIIPTNMLSIATARERRRTVKAVYIILMIMNCLAVLVYGSRGALLAIAAFSVYLGLVGFPINRNILPNLLAIAIIALLALYMDKIIDVLSNLSLSLGFRSRTLLLLSEGGTLHDSGRLNIWGSVWADCLRNPFMIRGLCSDYVLTGGYCHNVLLTLCHNFGIVAGAILIVVLTVLILRTLLGEDTSRGIICVLLLSAFFPLLLWSDTIWSHPWFWGWLVLQLRKGVSRRNDDEAIGLNARHDVYRRYDKSTRHSLQARKDSHG